MLIIVSGTSSSGKSSVCEVLKKVLGDSWLIFTTDAYLSMLGNKFLELHPNNQFVTTPNEVCYATKHNDGSYEIIPGALCSKLYLTIPNVLKLLSEQGFDIIVDSFITTTDEFNSYKLTLEKYQPHFFYLYASPEEIAKREKGRVDRLNGSALHWLRKFNFQDKCDLAINTEDLLPDQVMQLILNKLHLVP